MKHFANPTSEGALGGANLFSNLAISVGLNFEGLNICLGPHSIQASAGTYMCCVLIYGYKLFILISSSPYIIVAMP